MIAKISGLLRGLDGEWILSLSTPTDPRQMCDELKDKALDVEIKPHSNRRSLDANAFAWVLIDKLAQKTRLPKTEVYRNAIREIGGVSSIIGIKTDAVETFRKIWTTGHLGRQVEVIDGSGKEGWSNVRIHWGSSEFSSSQMSIFIDSLIQDCEALGIHTISPEEEAQMISRWAKKKENENAANTESKGSTVHK